MTVLDLYKSFKKVDAAAERLARCEDVTPKGAPEYFCWEHEKALSNAEDLAETVFNGLVDERIGEILYERERDHEYD